MTRTAAFLAATIALIGANALAGDEVDVTRTQPQADACAPEGNLRGDPTRGRILHREHCAGCHGADGKAQVIVMHMDTPPRDQSDAVYMKTLPDSFLYLAICGGGAKVGRNFIMPAWRATLSDQEMRDIIAWIRTFSGT